MYKYADFQEVLIKAAGFSMVATFLFLPFSLAAHNFALGITVLLILAAGLVFKFRGYLAKEPLVWSFVALFALVVFGSFYSVSSWDSALGINFNKYLKIIFGVLFLTVFLNEKYRELSFKAFFVGVFFVLLCTYLNIFFDLPWSLTKNRGWGVDHTVFGNYITQNIMMSFFVLQSFFYFGRAKKNFEKIFFLAVAVAAIASVIYLSNGRTGYFVLFGGAFVYFVFVLPKRWMLAGVSIILLAGVFAFGTSDRIQERFDLAQQETQLLFEQHARGEVPTFSSIGARWYMWMKSIELIKERPLTGWGLGSHGVKWCEKAPEPVWCQVGDTTPHNQFLFFGVELGILGIVAFCSLLGVLCWAAFYGEEYKALMMGFVAIFFCDSLVNASLWNAREYNFFIIMMCLLYSQARFSRKEK